MSLVFGVLFFLASPVSLLAASATGAQAKLEHQISVDKKSIVEMRGEKKVRQFDVLAQCAFSGVGKAEIRSLITRGKMLIVVFGKHDVADIELEGGKIICRGAN